MTALRPILAVALALGVGAAAAPGAAAPLDQDLARWPDGPRWTLVVPRLDRVLLPLAGAIQRLQQHAGWAEALGLPLSAFQARTGIDLTDPAALRAAGLGVEGPLWGHAGGQGTVVAVPFTDGPAAAAFGAVLAGLPAEPQGEGWRLGGLTLRHADGRALLTDAAPALTPFLGPAPAEGAPPTLTGCPRGPGEADLYWQGRNDGLLPGQVCVTVRFDPDRVRVDVRVISPLVAGWLGGPVAPAVGALPSQPAAVAAVSLGPKALRHLTRLAERRGQAQAAAAFGGSAVAAGGPGPQDVYVRVALAPGAPAGIPGPWRQALSQVARLVPSADGVDLFAREVEAEPKALGHAAREGDALVVRTAGPAPALAALPAALRGRAHVDDRLWAQASAVLWLRLSGAPHDGQPLLDAVQPALKFLGRDLAHARQVADAVAWVLAHLGETVIAAWPTSDGLDLAIEGVLL